MGGIIMRISTPYFNMYTTALPYSIKEGYYQHIKSVFDQHSINTPFGQNFLPVSLRWNMHPEFGFPRKPFNVYRRSGEYNFIDVFRNTSIPISGEHRISIPGGDMYIVYLHINLQSGQQCTVKPLNEEGKVIPYAFSTLNSTGNVLIKCPFTRGLLIEGHGEVTDCVAVSQRELINDKGWELIQIVGLPFDTGKIGGMGYEGTPQGYVGSPVSALKACMQRLAIGNILAVPMPGTGDATVPTPAWTPPHPAAYMDYLFNAPASILGMIQKCLESSNDLSYFPNQRQAYYLYDQVVRGISQGPTTPTEDAHLKIPVVATSLLAATTDCFAALGLGFGTTDFIAPKIQNSVSARMASTTPVRFNFGPDYMVTASYTIRPQENMVLPIFDDLTKEIEFAALGCEMPQPEIPAGLQALRIQRNRPAYIDGPNSEAVKLRWNKSTIPQGYGIISSYKNGASQVMNIPHSFQADCYLTFNAAVPKNVATQDDLPDANDIDHFVFTMREEPIPDYGTEPHKYLVAGLDVFGRWSAFREIVYNAESADKQNTGVIRTDLHHTTIDPPATISVVDCQYKIEFSWRWADRSVREIQFAGQFFNPVAGANPSRLTPPRFSKSSSNNIEPVLSVFFDTLGNPSCSQGAVSIIPVPADTPADLKKYMLMIDSMAVSFTNASPYKAGFALFARALERLRMPINEYCAWSNKYVCTLPDPRKPETVYIDAIVNFTALPDAAKIARGLLSWPGAAGAMGYHVWEGSETAVRTAIDQPLRSLFPSDPSKYLKPITAPLQERANQLRDILSNAGGLYTSLLSLVDKFFNRITKKPLIDPKMELTLPGSSKVLTLFKVSAVNGANIEGDKSSITFYAVPQLVKPLSPRIELKRRKEVTGGIERFFFEVNVLHGDFAPVKPPQDPTPSLSKVKAKGFELYRVRRQILVSDVGAKGATFKTADSPDWTDSEISMLTGEIYKGKKIVDEVTPSWKPYCYQAVAVGKENAPYGEVSGRSEGSSTMVAFCFPTAKPSLILSLFEGVVNMYYHKIVFTTDIPFTSVDGRNARIEIMHFNSTTKNFEIAGTPFEANAIRLATSTLPIPNHPNLLPQLPLINHLATDSMGITKVSVLLPRLEEGGSEPYAGLLRVIDPLGKITELKF